MTMHQCKNCQENFACPNGGINPISEKAFSKWNILCNCLKTLIMVDEKRSSFLYYCSNDCMHRNKKNKSEVPDLESDNDQEDSSDSGSDQDRSFPNLSDSES